MLSSTPNPLQNLLHIGLTSTPDKVALRFQHQVFSYRQLQDQIDRLALGLCALKIKKGDRIAMLLPNCPEAAMLILACYRIGAIAVPLNYRYKANEASYVLNHTAAMMLVFHVERRQIVENLKLDDALKYKYLVDSKTQESDYQAFSQLFDFPALDHVRATAPEDPALILYTSGSTGQPKGVVHSHQSVCHAIDISQRALGIATDDTVLIGKPISHAGGLQTQLMPTLKAGGEAILAMKPTPEQAVQIINQSSVTEYGLLASDLLDFIEYLELHSTPLPSLKNAIGSGDAVPLDLHHRFKALLGWEVLEGCGMTEVGCYYAMNPKNGQRKWGSMGLPCPDTEVEIINDSGHLCQNHEIGEFRVKSPSATLGYWQDPEQTRQLFLSGWLLTGDLGYCDEDGYLWFVSRKKLLIVRRGSNISPIEIESILDEHPAIHASVVVGITDSTDGEVPVAIIALLEPQKSLAEETLNAFLSASLADYKIPAHYLFVHDLPRNSTGKYDRSHLKTLAETEFGST